MSGQDKQERSFENSPSFRTILVQFCMYLGIPVPDREDEYEGAKQAIRLTRGFIEAYGKSRIPALVRNERAFKDRTFAFFGKRDLEEAAVWQNAIALLSRSGLSSDEANRLVDRLTLPGLRVHGDEELQGIADQFLKWEPLVRYIGEPSYRVGKEEFEKDLGDLIKKLADLMRTYVPAAIDGFDSEDATSEALLLVQVSVSDPMRGYRYEGDFPAWLSRTALNRLRTKWRDREAKVPGDDDAAQKAENTIAADSNPFEEVSDLEVFRQWQERFLLVSSFSKNEEKERRVKIIWEYMLREGDTSGATLVEIIGERLGTPIGLNTLATTMGRLRVRFDVLHYVLDLVPRGHPDEPGDASLILWLRRWGKNRDKLETIRLLAALGRASRRQNTLAWAVFSRYVVDRVKPGAFTTIVSKLKPLLLASGWNESDLKPTFEKASKWLEDPYRGILKELRHKARPGKASEESGAGVGFLLSPCWNLAVLQELQEEEALRVLRPSEEPPVEATYIRTAMGKLRGTA